MQSRGTVVFVSRTGPASPGGWPVGDLIAPLEARGWRVCVVAGPDGPVGGSLLRRLWSDAALRRDLRRRLRETEADVFVLTSQPPLLPLEAGPLAERGAVVQWVLDLYPDVASAVGLLPRAMAGPIRRRMARARGRADATVALGACMEERLNEQGSAPVETIPMWASEEAVPRERLPNAFRRAHGLGDDFVVMYAGHFGRVHPTRGVVRAAHALAEERLGGRAVRFVVVGGGPRWKELRERTPDTVQFVPSVPREALGEALAAADLHLVVQDERTRGMLVPSKVYGALASGRPVALLGPERSEAGRLVATSSWGRVVGSADGDGLADWIRTVAAESPSLPVDHGVPVPRAEDAAAQFDALFGALVEARR